MSYQRREKVRSIDIDIPLTIKLDRSELGGSVDELDILTWLTYPEVWIHLIEGGLPEVIRVDDLFVLKVQPKTFRHANELVKQLVEDFGINTRVEATTRGEHHAR